MLHHPYLSDVIIMSRQISNCQRRYSTDCWLVWDKLHPRGSYPRLHFCY
jgi:hypothetical protein